MNEKLESGKLESGLDIIKNIVNALCSYCPDNEGLPLLLGSEIVPMNDAISILLQNINIYTESSMQFEYNYDDIFKIFLSEEGNEIIVIFSFNVYEDGEGKTEIIYKVEADNNGYNVAVTKCSSVSIKRLILTKTNYPICGDEGGRVK